MAEKILYEVLTPRLKTILATCVHVAMKESKKFWAEHLLMPKASRLNACHQLRFNIYNLIAAVAENEPASRLTVKDIQGNEAPEFIFDSLTTIQIKKNGKKNKLPEPSRSRKTNAVKNNEQSLFAGTEYAGCYCLVTYNHDNFECSYIQIGIPDAEYTCWLQCEDITNYVEHELAESIEKQYGDEIQVAIAENIHKQFGLTINE